MLKAYKDFKDFNVFEKRFILYNGIAIALLMFGSVFVSALNFLEDGYKMGVITIFIIAYAWFRHDLWNKLESLESEWKDEKQMQFL